MEGIDAAVLRGFHQAARAENTLELHGGDPRVRAQDEGEAITEYGIVAGPKEEANVCTRPCKHATVVTTHCARPDQADFSKAGTGVHRKGSTRTSSAVSALSG